AGQKAVSRARSPAMKTIPALGIVGLVAAISLAAAAPPKKKDDKPEKVDPVAFIKKFDTDNDGKLDKTELSTGLRSLKQNSVTTKNDAWKKFDEDGDGKI